MSKKPTKKRAKETKLVRPTLISLLLDESGSMAQVWDATIASFNSYVDGIRENADAAKNCYFTFTKFDSNHCDPAYVAKPLAEVEHLTKQSYVPHAYTPLYDAIGKTVRAMEAWVSKQEVKPKVLFVIQTDGQENHSREFSLGAIQSIIKAKEAEGWSFVYLGAGQEAWMGAGMMGIQAGNTVHYQNNAPGVRVMTASLSASTASYLVGAQSLNFTATGSTGAFFSTDGITTLNTTDNVANAPEKK